MEMNKKAIRKLYKKLPYRFNFYIKRGITSLQKRNYLTTSAAYFDFASS